MHEFAATQDTPLKPPDVPVAAPKMNGAVGDDRFMATQKEV
jgi:hypothetical protein